MRSRIADCGLRNGRARPETPGLATAHPLDSAFRIPHSAFAFLLAACTPITSRPAFLPYPQALVAIVEAPAPRIVPEAMGWLANEGLRVEWSSPQDGYVESAWFNVRTRASTTGQGDPGALLDTIKLRCWVDPNAPGKSQLTVEAVYRPMLDPSRPERDLEVIVPQGSEGHRIAVQLIEAMKQKFGS